MKIIKKNWRKLGLLFYVFLTPLSLLYASCDAGKICNPINAGSIQALILAILTGMIQVGIPIIALAIVYAGFLFVFARGNSEKLTKAKSALITAVIGGAILLGSMAIAEIIKSTVAGLS